MAGTPADEATTTTTTVAPDDSTTTTTTVVDAGAAERTPVEKQGEQVIDKAENATTTNDNVQSTDERLDAAKADALRNHDTEHAHDGEDGRSAPADV